MIDWANLDFGALWRYREPLLWGLLQTLWLAGAAFAIAVPAGTLLAVGRARGRWWLRLPIVALVDVIRFTPLLVQAVWIHFALPLITGVATSAMTSGLIALALHVAAYVCEIVRSGIQAIPKGQWEAAKSLGLRPSRAFRLVVMPQVWPIVLPPLASTAVSTFKLTAVLGIIAISDLTKAANRINTLLFKPFEVYTATALIYLAVGLVLAWIAHLVERRVTRSRRGREAPPLTVATPAVEGARHGA